MTMIGPMSSLSDPEDERCEACKLFGQCPGYYNGCFEAVNNPDKMEVL